MNIDIFDDYAVDIDSDCLHNDFDDYDLYGERMEENEHQDGYGDDIEFE